MSGVLVWGRMLDMSETRISPTYPRFRITDDGAVIGPSGKTLTPMLDRDGYPRISIYMGEKRWKRVPVHFLVCEAFHGPKPSDSHLVAHGNGDPADNRASNLRWATSLENEADKRIHGRSLRGEGHHQVKLTESQVRTIRERRASGEQIPGMAREYGVSRFAIWAVVNRRTWRHI